MPKSRTSSPDIPPAKRAAVLLRRELLLTVRRAAWLPPMLFLAIVLSLAAVALKGDGQLYLLFAPTLLWAGLLLACLLITEPIFNEDLRDGSLHQLIAHTSLSFALTVRMGAWMVGMGLPLCLSALLISFALGLGGQALTVLLTTLPAGVFALLLIGAFGSAMALGRGGLLAGILSMPLALPVILFAVAALDFSLTGVEWGGAALRLWLFTALLAVAMPFVTGAVLRLHLE